MSLPPTPLASVVVGDDGSVGAAAAVGWARRAVELAGGRLVVVRVTGEESTGGSPGVTASEGHDARTVRGAPVAALLGAVDDLGADLLVVGRRGGGGFERLRLGSTAHQLAEHSPVPVAVVATDSPDGQAPWPVSRIVVGLDGSEPARTALRWAAGLARRAGARVSVAHAVEFAAAFAAAGVPPVLYRSSVEARRGELDEWAGDLAEAGVGYDTILEEGGPAGVVLAAARATGAQLVVVGRRGGDGPSGLPMGSTAHRVIAFAPCPAVVVPAIGEPSALPGNHQHR